MIVLVSSLTNPQPDFTLF
jgi:hypothetical protein